MPEEPSGNGSAPQSPAGGRASPYMSECFMCGAQSGELPGRQAADEWLEAHAAECPEGTVDL